MDRIKQLPTEDLKDSLKYLRKQIRRSSIFSLRKSVDLYGSSISDLKRQKKVVLDELRHRKVR